ncbi:MAG: hypothetical protein FJX76_14940 [Armatimonadetes bacterium]|nr:hypothetical protein [Armatimonadota bacterium]
MRIESLRPIPTPPLRRPLPREGDALSLIIPGAEDLQVDVDPALWTAVGNGRKALPGGLVEVDLGFGRVRRDYPDGRQTIDGTRRLGQPVHRVRKPDGVESWQIDYSAVMQSMQADLNGTDRGGPLRVEQLEGARVLRYPTGARSNEYTRLEVEGRGAFHLASDGPLSRELLQNMAQAILEAPPRAFEKIPLMFVLGELGGSRDAFHRPIGEVAGFAQYQSKTLFFARERLATLASAKETMWHEAGHLFDRDHRASETLKDEKQVPIFGYGKLIMEGAKVAVDESDFITRYASTNEQEDFAENHRAALEAREKYKQQHPDSDFFTLSSGEVEAILKDSGYGEPIRRRMASIVRIYQEDATPAATRTSGT